jgi:hypothetical protein
MRRQRDARSIFRVDSDQIGDGALRLGSAVGIGRKGAPAGCRCAPVRSGHDTRRAFSPRDGNIERDVRFMLDLFCVHFKRRHCPRSGLQEDVLVELELPNIFGADWSIERETDCKSRLRFCQSPKSEPDRCFVLGLFPELFRQEAQSSQSLWMIELTEDSLFFGVRSIRVGAGSLLATFLSFWSASLSVGKPPKNLIMAAKAGDRSGIGGRISRAVGVEGIT